MGKKVQAFRATQDLRFGRVRVGFFLLEFRAESLESVESRI